MIGKGNRYQNIMKNAKNTNSLANKRIMTKTIYNGKVIDIDDPKGIGRVKVRIIEDGVDKLLSDSDIPWAFSLVDKSIHVPYGLGDGVKVVLGDLEKPNNDRYVLCRLIPQYQNIQGTPYEYGTVMSDKPLMAEKRDIDTIPQANGVFPKKSEQFVSIIGKNNSDLNLKDRCYEIRAGKHIIDKPTEKNDKNPSYLKGIYTEESESINVMLSDVNILASYVSSQGVNFDGTLLEEKMIELKEKAQSIPYGEILVEFLEIFRIAFLTHVHPYSNVPPVSNVPQMSQLKNFNTDSILSKQNKLL